MRDEYTLIRRITRAVPAQIGSVRSGYGLAFGIGDDAAILNSPSCEPWVISCDAFVEGVHFLADIHPADSVGYKALVRATSDLVAMGALPRLFLLTLMLPEGRCGGWLNQFLMGMGKAAKYLDMRLAGGDTTTGTTVSISIVVLGHMRRKKSPRTRSARRGLRQTGGPLTRSGGRAGDQIYVSGTLGRAQVGLELVRQMKKQIENPKIGARLRDALQAHLYPRLRVELGSWLASNGVASAMMDLSDGLSTDLARLCRAGCVGAKLWAEKIPTISLPRETLRRLPSRFDPLQAALNGGDDYELLFTVPKRNQRQLRGAPDSSHLTCVGELTSNHKILLVGADGLAKPLRSGGWDPFRK